MAPKIVLNASRKEMVMVLAFAVLLGLYVFYGTSCFRTQPIHIELSVRPAVQFVTPGDPGAKPRTVYVTSIALDREYPLTSIEVLRVGDLPDNKPGFPLWHLVGKSAPTRSLVYGNAPAGMTPYVSGARPTPLEPGVAYRILIEAGRLRGQHDFTITAEDATGR
ncbi:MAG TPA: hypothetical protein VIK53_19595 [Verrucomicrobiae bacterium]